MGDIIFEEDLPTEPYPIHFVDQLPKFKNTPQNLSKEEEKKYFQSKFSDFVKANFETSKFKNLGIKGTQRIFVLFEIEKTGQITIKKIRAPHHSLENEAKRVFEKLPKFIPAKHDGKQVAVTNTLPITFNAED